MVRNSGSTTNPLASSAFLILVALADQPRYGLSIAEEVARYTKDRIQLGPGTLYNTIKKLLDGGLVEAAPTRDDDDPRRRYYAITPTGQAAVRSEAARLTELVDAIRDKHLTPSRG